MSTSFSNNPHQSQHGMSYVSQDIFGDNYTTFTPFSNYSEESSKYAIGLLRWPGGTFSENNTTTYNLTNSDIYDGNPLKGLTQLLTNADEAGRNFSMMIPTKWVFNNQSMLGNFEVELGQFLTRLTSFNDGYYDTADFFFGNGHSLILEIGNETAHYGWANNDYDEDWNYGSIAYHALNVQSAHTQSGGFDISFAVQMGVNAGGAAKIINELDGSKAGRDSVLSQIDVLVTHGGLVTSAADFDYLDEYKKIKYWSSAIGDDWEDVELFASGWSIGVSSDGYYDIILDGALGNGANVGDVDMGARQGAATADVFSQQISLGYDLAAVWGTVDPKSNANSYQQYVNLGYWHPDNDETRPPLLSHGGEVLRLMAESLVGTTLHEGNTTTNSAGIIGWNASYFDWASGNGSGAVNSYLYSDDAKYVLLASVTDIDGVRDTYTGSLTHSFDISGLDAVSYVWAETVTTEFNQGGWDDFKDAHPELTGNDLLSFRRLFETPVTSRERIAVNGSNEIEYSFSSDFETVRFILAKTNPGEGYLHLWGGESSDTLTGGASADLLEGNGGNDTLNGGDGNDVLESGDGEDIVHGGHDDDLLLGRAGDDTIFGDAGDDRVYAGAGQDHVDGGAGNDDLKGGSGDDDMSGGDGDDLMDGENGNDILAGNSGSDDMRGSGGDDQLFGGDGNDVLRGGDDNDALNGDGGDDTLSGNLGDDTLNGGNGNDRLFGGGGDDQLNGNDEDDRIDGGIGNDTLRGGDAADILLGRSNNDILAGNSGADRLYGGEGDDRLFGGSGDDELWGGSDDDRLSGGDGSDSLSGDSGSDTFVFENHAGTDTVQDFTNGTDMIEYGGVGGYADLTVAAVGADVDITGVGGGHMLLLGTDLADITAADFIFI